MRITVSSPGKIHLLGEHAVVYGKPAFLSAINVRTYATIDSCKEKTAPFQIEAKENGEFIQRIIRDLGEKYSIHPQKGTRLSIQSSIPTGSGLGSSAAVTASVVGVLMKAMKNIWNPPKINEITYEIEKITHGNPSGADNTTIVFGGLVWYRREFDFLKSLWSLPIASYTFPQLYLLQSGRPIESTKEMVELVARNYKRKKLSFDTLFNDQETQTKNLLLSLKSANISGMKKSIKEGGRNLEKMGVVGKRAQRIIREIESSGGVAKITGAGGVKQGSGMLLCFNESVKMLEEIAQKYKTKLFPVKIGEEGIRIEEQNGKKYT